MLLLLVLLLLFKPELFRMRVVALPLLLNVQVAPLRQLHVVVLLLLLLLLKLQTLNLPHLLVQLLQLLSMPTLFVLNCACRALAAALATRKLQIRDPRAQPGALGGGALHELHQRREGCAVDAAVATGGLLSDVVHQHRGGRVAGRRGA
jgi:hypothetical protein